MILSLAIGRCVSAKSIDRLMLKNEIKQEHAPGNYGIDHNKKDDVKIEEELIQAYNCEEGGTANAKISLNPPAKCNRADGSAYEAPSMKRAQVLEKVKKIPVNITACMIQFRVNVGWCGGEFAISSYMHNDVETLRDTIIPTTTQCNSAELDGYIPITTPQYGSLQPLELELKLRGGVGHGMFQPKGFSRPDSWCKGFPFLPPKNMDDAIRYVDFKNYFEKKQIWPTERIRRAVVPIGSRHKSRRYKDTSSTKEEAWSYLIHW